MKQFSIEGKTITLKVKKSPIIVRGIMFLFAFASFILPIIGMIAGISSRKGFHMGYLVGIFLFGLIGFYLLRISLWNTYGVETIKLFTAQIEYEADYGWFKDGKKSIQLNNLKLSINHVGYQEDNLGTLVVSDDNEKIESVVKMHINQLEELINEIKNL